jgi:hypothetical protein
MGHNTMWPSPLGLRGLDHGMARPTRLGSTAWPARPRQSDLWPAMPHPAWHGGLSWSGALGRGIKVRPVRV